jgi:T-complex protein 1 subunit theta
VIRNIQAVSQVTEIVRTSFGPNGRNKMVINVGDNVSTSTSCNGIQSDHLSAFLAQHLDRLFVTNDAATILRELEVVHPAAKVLVMASQQQEAEVRCIYRIRPRPLFDQLHCRWETAPTSS